MKMETVVYCVFALLLGMLLANMLKNVCGCKTVEGMTAVRKVRDICDPIYPKCANAGLVNKLKKGAETCGNSAMKSYVNCVQGGIQANTPTTTQF